MTTTDRARTPIEKSFKAAMRKIGWHVYRDDETGRLVTNCYEREVLELSKRIAMLLEAAASNGAMVKAAPVEPAAVVSN